jgi:PKD repeat protein
MMGVSATLTAADSCHKSMPFCTGTIYSFPAGVNTGNAQSGPNYGCLSSRPNPVWYHMKIENPGNITIRMEGVRVNGQSLDIDFALWGPYANPVTPCTSQLTANCQGSGCPNNTNNPNFYPSGNLHDCSYSGSGVEHAHIVNGQTGQYFILLITNYANAPGNITFQQTGGTGTTDCTILPPPATSNSPVCIGGNIQLNAANVPGASYQWSGPGGFISNQQNPLITGVTAANAGIYTLTITYNGITSEPTNTEVFVYPPPTATISGTTSICEGDSALITIAATSVGPFRVTMTNGLGGIPQVINFWQATHTFWVYPTATSTYTLTSVSNNACSGTTSGQAVVTVRQKPVPDFSSANRCTQQQTQFTDNSSVPVGGISSWNWDFGDGGSSNLQNPSHIYTSSGMYNVNLVVAGNNGCENSTVKVVAISPTPQTTAGPDKTIPYGTNTQLNGAVTGGSGTHTYQWQPADKVVNALIPNPNTVLLAATTDFTLTATDSGNGCISSDQVTVNITGGPLAGLIQVAQPEICIGGSTLLNAQISGGSSNYTYTWTSNPPGFTSSLEDVTVNPTVTTTYFLSVFDGFNTIQAQTQVIVNPLPVPNAGADQTIPHGTSTVLTSQVTGGTAPYAYLWSPASMVVAPTMHVTPTTNLYSSQSFDMRVTDSKGCISTGQTVVTISGGPLQVNPVAVQPIICRNESTIIRAIPGGGSNEYVSYSWTSVPAGFTSTASEPTVSPLITTVYKVIVNDGYNTVEGETTVTVNQLPVINLVPVDPKVQPISATEIGVCVFDTVTIDAGNAGANYLWSNGASTQSIDVLSSGISFDMREYSVIVTNQNTGCVNSSNITIYFTFSNCSYGISEMESDNRLVVFPNPSADGTFNYTITSLKGETLIEVFTIDGRKVMEEQLMLLPGQSKTAAFNLNRTSGIYLLKLTNKDAVIMKRLINQ